MPKLATTEDVLRIAQETLPKVDFTTDSLLVDDGLLDSLSVMLLISAFSMEYDIIFDIECLVPKKSIPLRP